MSTLYDVLCYTLCQKSTSKKMSLIKAFLLTFNKHDKHKLLLYACVTFFTEPFPKLGISTISYDVSMQIKVW